MNANPLGQHHSVLTADMDMAGKAKTNTMLNSNTTKIIKRIMVGKHYLVGGIEKNFFGWGNLLAD